MFWSKKKVERDVLLRCRIKELENIICPGKLHDFIWHHHPIHGGWMLHVTQKNHAHMTVKINFCPICGRRLEDDHA